MNIPHIPVLYKETLETFKDINDGYIIDCTTGFAGHSSGLLTSNENVKLICNDQDDEALEFSKKRLEPYTQRVIFNKGNFEHVIDTFKNYEIRGILADIGVSSLQLDKLDRGFGFDSNTLDMRMNQNQSLDAATVVNTYSLAELERVFKDCGEVREYKKVASLIVNNRPFTSAKEISELLAKKMPKGKIHPATLPFQGIRIEVNDELGVLERLFIFVFIITNNWHGIGFLLTAKSVFRFGDLSKSDDRKLTEYILIGTLLSFGLALLIGLGYNYVVENVL